MRQKQDSNFSVAHQAFDRDLLLAVVETIIPSGHLERAMPAASDLTEFRSLPSEEALFIYGPLLDWVEASDQARGSVPFVSLERDQRETILREIEEERPDLIKGAVLQTLIRYYGADEVAEGLGLEARAPHPGGYSLKETDWALLDPVKQMDPLYRKADGPGDES
jgi:hypothetical protein